MLDIICVIQRQNKVSAFRYQHAGIGNANTSYQVKGNNARKMQMRNKCIEKGIFHYILREVTIVLPSQLYV